MMRPRPPPLRPSAISIDALVRVGKTLYGEQWQSPLARELGMSERSVRYLVSGERAIHAGIVTDLIDIIGERGEELKSVAKELRAALRQAS